jgi:hypothetical protein
MLNLLRWSLLSAVCVLSSMPVLAADVVLPPGVKVEENPTDAKATKIVLIAGSNYFKPGEHEYIAGCAALADLLKQTPGVAPVLAIDWPQKPETLQGAKSVVMFFDGGKKHGLLTDDRFAQIQKLADQKVGIVGLHQLVDFPEGLGDKGKSLLGATFKNGSSKRAHWVHEFKTFPEHAITRGVTPFQIDDGYLWKLDFVPERKGVTPLMSTIGPKDMTTKPEESVVAWAYERENGGKSFTFTGAHLHASLGQEGYRRLLTNAALWTAGVEVPKAGAPVQLDAARLNGYLAPKPVAAK